jgi:LuxR family transcriptional regulator, quorum-sensing system regulator BjaR1
MNRDRLIASIETLNSREALRDVLHNLIGDFGFGGFCFLDISDAYKNDFLYFGTTGQRWESEYLTHSFFEVDEVIKVGRRTNRPFIWSDVPLPERLGKKRSGALKVFEASKDYHFNNGLVIPLHFVDEFGRYHSALCSMTWMSGDEEFRRVRDEHGKTLHFILTYWLQRVIDVEATNKALPADIMTRRRTALNFKLTDRERDVLSWAARGKTTQDTADIIGISNETVITHMKAAMNKIAAGNKTHAVAKALHLGLIDL